MEKLRLHFGCKFLTKSQISRGGPIAGKAKGLFPIGGELKFSKVIRDGFSPLK